MLNGFQVSLEGRTTVRVTSTLLFMIFSAPQCASFRLRAPWLAMCRCADTPDLLLCLMALTMTSRVRSLFFLTQTLGEDDYWQNCTVPSRTLQAKGNQKTVEPSLVVISRWAWVAVSVTGGCVTSRLVRVGGIATARMWATTRMCVANWHSPFGQWYARTIPSMQQHGSIILFWISWSFLAPCTCLCLLTSK